MVEEVLRGQVFARSDDTVVIEGNHYFPPGDASRGHVTVRETDAG